tara:strand:- start:2955 stop:3215 length:261 start_codon:yes stop_codon:yes gene_type:complete
MDKQTEINEGREAESILESDVFKKAFINYKNELIKEWESTSRKELEIRENLFRAVQSLPEIERHLRIIVEKGKLTSKEFNILKKVS